MRIDVRKLVCGFIFFCTAGAYPAEAQRVGVGNRAPDIDLPTLNGGRIKLSKLRDHPVVLSFWGTWCPPCRDEFPELVRLHTKHADDGLIIVAINGRDQELSTKDVQRFVEAFSVSFPVALDKRGSVRRAYRIEGQPTTIFIDSTGVIRKVHVGRINRDELDEGISLILPRRE